MKYRNILVFLVLGVVLNLTSCKKDEFIYQKEIKSNSLVKILKSKGLEFKGNNLVVDDKARAIKTLDLSGLGLKDFNALQRLEVLPNLEKLILRDNNFSYKVDLSKLPKQIQYIDLSDNIIYEYNGLVKVNVDKAIVSTLRSFKELILPYSARFNVEALPFYFKENEKSVKILMQNRDGQLKPYTTLREIPDPILRKYLKRVFKSKFSGDKLDLFKNFSLTDKNAIINLTTVGGFWGDPDLEGVDFTSIEGIEYILNDHRYAGEFFAMRENKEKAYTTGYLKLGKHCAGINISQISTPILDLSRAESIYKCFTTNNLLLESVDLSASKMMMQRGEKGWASWLQGDMLAFVSCPKLKRVKLPDLSKSKKLTTVNYLVFQDLPKLESVIDLSGLQVAVSIRLGGLYSVPKFIYPKKIAFFLDDGAKVEQKEGEVSMDFIIDKDVYKRHSTQDFIARYKPFLEDQISNYIRDVEYFNEYNQKLQVYHYKEIK